MLSSFELPIIFSPDARYLVRCHTLSLPATMRDDWEHAIICAYLTIIDRHLSTVRDLPLYTTLDRGWTLPEALQARLASRSLDAAEREALGIALRWVQSGAFDDAAHIVLRLFDGSSRRVDVADATLATLPSLPERPPPLREMPDVDQETLRQLILEHQRSLFPSPEQVSHPHDDAHIVEADRYAPKRKKWIAGSDRHIIWDPDDALAMIWLKQGREIATIHGEPPVFNERHDQHLAFERRSWPDLELLSHVDLLDWSGVPLVMIELSSDQGVAIHWDAFVLKHGQLRSIMYRLSFGGEGEKDRVVTQLRTSMYAHQHALQSENGQYLFCLNGMGVLWPTHVAMFRWTRRMIVGWATRFDWQSHTSQEMIICEDFPANWQPPNLDQCRSSLLPWYSQTPIGFIEGVDYIDGDRLRIHFVTGRDATVVIK